MVLISDDWNGFNVLHTAASRVAALDWGWLLKAVLKVFYHGAESGDIKVSL